MTRAVALETVPLTGSTNADLLARLGSGELIDEHYWLRAERQESGRGRLGRSWTSEAGNLFCSTVVHVNVADPPVTTLSFVAALAVHDAIAHRLGGQSSLRLKWPNDVEVGGAKIAGILLERLERFVVVGIGINVAHAPTIEGRRTISMREACQDAAIGPAEVLVDLADRFAVRLDVWRSRGSDATLAQWSTRSHKPSEQLTVSNPGGGNLQGSFAGVSADGALRLRMPDGSIRDVYAGDIGPG
ncbi:biotin--[acetyl-CoA-carboxylase] ligase [Parapontixanthobacter aurantiacus]|uniref:biotin--[acetyl-CoA-carboxylase] ligase n=1 Tax=Parapontixanthobacter aurantiacus TaxID=1463599 RepID=UPI00301D720F